MADYEAINGVASGSVEAVNGVAKGSIQAANGLTIPASATEAGSILHWWKLNDSAATQVDSKGSASMTGANVTLTSSGRGSLSVCTYNGTSSLSTVAASSVESALMTSPMSVSFWLKYHAGPGNYDGVVSCTSNGGTIGDDGVVFYNYGGRFNFGASDGAIGGSKWISYNQYAYMWGNGRLWGSELNEWHHITGVLDDGNDIHNLYVDAVIPTGSAGTGSLGAAYIYTPSLDTTTDMEFGLGALHSPGGGIYAGSYSNYSISDLRIYSIALSAAQVALIYNSGDGDWTG